MKYSAGILLYKKPSDVLLVHPGGPYYTNSDMWVIPKGEIEPDEDKFEAAKRELFEETGIILDSKTIYLGEFKQSEYKSIFIWAAEQDFNPKDMIINYIEIDFCGKQIIIPEIDKAKWFDINEAKEKIHKGQKQVLDKLELILF